jgi:hypothetical protein
MRYQILDFPIPTKNVIESVLQMQNRVDRLIKLKSKKEGVLSDNQAHWVVIDAPLIVKQWVKENIEFDCYTALQFFQGGDKIFPHIDGGRDKVFNFIIETGGVSVKTCFWKPKTNLDNTKFRPREWIDHRSIDLVESVVFEKNQWCYIDTTQIHSVENLDPSTKRIAITLSPVSNYGPISRSYMKRYFPELFE